MGKFIVSRPIYRQSLDGYDMRTLEPATEHTRSPLYNRQEGTLELLLAAHGHYCHFRWR